MHGGKLRIDKSKLKTLQGASPQVCEIYLQELDQVPTSNTKYTGVGIGGAGGNSLSGVGGEKEPF